MPTHIQKTVIMPTQEHLERVRRWGDRYVLFSANGEGNFGWLTGARIADLRAYAREHGHVDVLILEIPQEVL